MAAMLLSRSRLRRFGLRSLCTSAETAPLHVCVVGSGPAGFYVVKKLLRRFGSAQIDILDRLPHPFGLVRSGVAPDHPATKVVVNQFSRAAEDERCRFYGNVCLGSDVSLEELRKTYHIVVLAYGAESDNKLKIPGENLKGVFSAREFVWWYNGHPDCKNLPINLKDTETAVVLGQGNVAIDVARILLRCPEDLEGTDIAEHALKALRESRIRKVCLVGRRGPVQAACTSKELREILNMDGVNVTIREADLQTSNADLIEMQNSRLHKKVYELFSAGAAQESTGGEKQLDFMFFRAPVALLPSDEDKTRVRGVRLEKTKLEGEEGQRKLVNTGSFEELDCGLVLKSIGYKSLPVPGLPFDSAKGIVPNTLGRVLSNKSTRENGLYVAGWLKRGPTGIIATNEVCANEVVGSISEDAKSSASAFKREVPGRAGLEAILNSKNVRYVSFPDWEKVNEVEVNRGGPKGKPREKLVDVEEVLRVARGAEN